MPDGTPSTLALADAIRAVAAASSQDPTAVLDVLAHQAEALLGCHGASIQAELARRIMNGAEAAARTVARLQQIIRFEETETSGYQMLNLEAATTPLGG